MVAHMHLLDALMILLTIPVTQNVGCFLLGWKRNQILLERINLLHTHCMMLSDQYLCLRTPLMAAMHEDESDDLREVGELLSEILEVNFLTTHLMIYIPSIYQDVKQLVLSSVFFPISIRLFCIFKRYT